MTELDPNLVEGPYPLQHHLGFRMAAWQPDYCRFELPLAPFLMNRYGIPHGGIHATLLDTVMGFAGCFTGDRNAPRLAMTLSLNVNYLGRSEGVLLIGEGRRTGGGRATFFASGEVRDDRGALIANGSGVFRYRKGETT
jgi:uncharacterized protein (TIGR00369 family)